MYWTNKQNLKTRYKEHIRPLNNRMEYSKYVYNILNNRHSFWEVEISMSKIGRLEEELGPNNGPKRTMLDV
jgi:hypothetical protein